MLSNAVTKHFVEIQPATEPSDASWYTNYINTRQFTLSSIVQLCRLTTGLSVSGNISKVLESDAFGQPFWFIGNEEFVDKCILQVDYLFDVWVNRWSLICESDDYKWFAKFKWQALNETNNTWVDIDGGGGGGGVDTVKKAITSFMNQGGNKIEWTFPNPANSAGKRYKSWRVIGEAGTSDSGWINLLLMNLQ